MLTSQQLMSPYQQQLHPEGGYYLQTYCSAEMIPALELQLI